MCVPVVCLVTVIDSYSNNHRSWSVSRARLVTHPRAGERLGRLEGHIPRRRLEWVEEPSLLRVHQAKDGVGHFVPEDAPEETAEVILAWAKRLKLVGNL